MKNDAVVKRKDNIENPYRITIRHFVILCLGVLSVLSFPRRNSFFCTHQKYFEIDKGKGRSDVQTLSVKCQLFVFRYHFDGNNKKFVM